MSLKIDPVVWKIMGGCVAGQIELKDKEKYVDMINKKIINMILEKLEDFEKQLPDDQWDEQHWKGIRSGLIVAINRILGTDLNYNLTSKEITKKIGGESDV